MQRILFLGVLFLLTGLPDGAWSQSVATDVVPGSRSLVDDEYPRIQPLTHSLRGITHLKGQRFIDLSLGTMDRLSSRPFSGDNSGVGFQFSTGRYRRQLDAWKILLSYGQKQFLATYGNQTVRVPYALYAAGYGYEFTLARSADRLRVVRAEVAGLSLYESINHDDPLVRTDQQTFGLGMESRFGLGADAAVVAQFHRVCLGVRQRWVPNAAYGRFHTFLTLGVRLTN